LEQGVGMADARVKIAKDKAELVKALKDGSDMNGPFQTYADVIAFAAALGANKRKRVPLQEISKELDPIRLSVFDLKGFGTLFNLLAVYYTKDPKTLANSDELEEERICIFEEYANAGLEIIEEMTKGSIDFLDHMLLFLPQNSKK
jgi:dnd system-associated protein 4